MSAVTRGNWPLHFGLAIVGLFVLWGLLGPFLAPQDPMARHRLVQLDNGRFAVAPFDPFEMSGYPLGTDSDGRDILSRMLWAARPTLLVACTTALVWLTLGVVVGVGAGWSRGPTRTILRSLIDVAHALPLLIVAIFALYALGSEHSPPQLVAALCVTGWSSVAELTESTTRRVRGTKYVEAARALGARDARILARHVVPQMAPMLPVLGTLQIGSAFLILGELGFLGFYLGGGDLRAIPDANSPAFLYKVIPGQPELAQLLGAGWENIFQTPWMAVWAGAGFFLAILGFTLLGEGLRRRLLV